ncbi:pilus assembly protein PilM [Paenibacillus sp. TRM 82003]|nr:pilus assembly protein PilM [Paenibacillus sp. TRM 82003]
MKSPWHWLASRFGSRSLGIEITDTHVKWVEVANGDSLRLTAADAEPLPGGTVDEGRILQPSAVIQALQTLKLRSAMKTKRVHLVLPSSLTMVRFLKLPDVAQRDLKRMIDFELRYNIPLPFDKPYYDFMKLPDERQAESHSTADPMATESAWGTQNTGTATGQWDLGNQEAAVGKTDEGGEEAAPAKECEVMLVAAPLDTIEEYAGLLTSVGLRPASIEIKALSLHRTVECLKPIEPTSTYVSVDITPTYTDVSIYHNGALRITRNKPMRFPKEVSVESDAWSQFEFQTACQDLTSEIERFINFYRYSLNHREQEIEGMTVSGDIDELDAVIAYLADRFAFPVKRMSMEDIYSSAKHGGIPMAGFAGALGLSLRGKIG